MKVYNPNYARFLAQTELDSLPKAKQDSTGDPKLLKLKKACQDFEAIFVKQMLKSMKGTVEKTGLLDGGFAEEIYDDMLYDEYAKKMVKTAGFGIADTLYDKLSVSAHDSAK